MRPSASHPDWKKDSSTKLRIFLLLGQRFLNYVLRKHRGQIWGRQEGVFHRSVNEGGEMGHVASAGTFASKMKQK